MLKILKMTIFIFKAIITYLEYKYNKEHQLFNINGVAITFTYNFRSLKRKFLGKFIQQ